MPKAGWKKNPETGKYDPPVVDDALRAAAREVNAIAPSAPPIRFDPDDAPIDGDFQKDHLVGKDPSKVYALVHADDMPRMRGRGYVPTVRGPDAAHPIFDAGSESDPNYMVDNLLQMEIPRERAERIQREAERRGSARWNSEQESQTYQQSDRSVSRQTERIEQSVMTR